MATAIAAPPLWPHQEAALNALAHHRGALLDAGLGSGKSRVALELARRRGVRRLLILGPKGVVLPGGQWEMQLCRWWPEIPMLNLSSGRVDSRVAQIERFQEGVILANYDVLSPVPGPTKRKKLTPPQAFVRALCVWFAAHNAAGGGVKHPMMVCDECHQLKAPSGAHSKAAAQIGELADWRLGLSGTPLAHSPLDVWAIYRWLNQAIFGPSYVGFKHRYTTPSRWGSHDGVEASRGGLQPYKFTELDDLRKRMYSIGYQCDGAPQIPQIDAVRVVELEPEVERFYRRFDRELTAILNGIEYDAANILAKIMRLQQITSGSLPDDEGEQQPVSNAKRRELAEWMSELPTEAEPAVVFCRFVADLDAVHAAAESTGRASLEFSGRRKELRRWLDGEAPILAVQVQSGGVGIELHRAHYACYVSLTRSLVDYVQSRGRLVRPDQEHSWVHFTFLIARGTIDEDIMEAFDKREDLLEQVYQKRKKHA